MVVVELVLVLVQVVRLGGGWDDMAGYAWVDPWWPCLRGCVSVCVEVYVERVN